MLTEKEKMVLDAILSQPSGINSDKIDIKKSFEENAEGWESGIYFWTDLNYKDYGCNLGKSVFAGVVASLNKKGLIQSGLDQWWGGSCQELFINESNFNNIVKEYAGL